MGRLEGRVAVVTGAGRGIGRAHALLLAAEGARLVINDLGGSMGGEGADPGPAAAVVEEIRAAGGEAVYNTDDVADWDGASRLIHQAIDTYGDLHILVNNAGVIRNRMVFNLAEFDWDAVVRVHGKGTFAPTHFACIYWRQRAKETGDPVYGRLVHTSSVSGLFAAASQSAYAFAKAGVVAFGVAVAKEMVRYGVTSNVVAPAARTRLTEDVFPEARDPDTDPGNNSPIVVYLCLPEAQGISGQVFSVFGRDIALVDQHRAGPVLHRDERWTVDDMVARVPALFEGRPMSVSATSGLPDLTRLADEGQGAGG
jgi:NAD(P)-dependent dehydrogenase (short-subunit alcohol dehydrogenase family)